MMLHLLLILFLYLSLLCSAFISISQHPSALFSHHDKDGSYHRRKIIVKGSIFSKGFRNRGKNGKSNDDEDEDIFLEDDETSNTSSPPKKKRYMMDRTEKLLDSLASGDIDLGKFERKLKRFNIKEIVSLQTDIDRRKLDSAMDVMKGYSSVVYYDEFGNPPPPIKPQSRRDLQRNMEKLANNVIGGKVSKQEFMTKVFNMGQDEISSLEIAVLERKRKVALNLILRELQKQAFLAALGGAGVGLVPGFILAIWLVAEDETNLSLSEAIIEIPLASAVLTSLLVYRFSLPFGRRVNDNLDTYDSDFAQSIRNSFSAGPKKVGMSISQAVDRVVSGPASVYNELKVNIFIFYLGHMPFKITKLLWTSCYNRKKLLTLVLRYPIGYL